MRSLLMVAVFWAAPAFSQGTADPLMNVISFTGSLEVLSGGKAISLRPGSAGYALKPGAELLVSSGDADLLCEGTIVRVTRGDSFLYIITEGQPSLIVRQGQVDVRTPDGKTRVYSAGQLAWLLSAPPAAMPLSPVSAGEPAPVPAEQSASPAWDPLKALAARMDERPRLSLELELRPFYRLRTLYDDNIYLVPAASPPVGGGVQSSLIMHNELGVRLSLPLSRRHKLEGGYSFKATSYSKQPKTNNAYDQTVDASFSFEPARGWQSKLWENYLNTEDPAFSEVVARERRWQNQAGGKVEGELGRRLVIGADLSHTRHHYLSPALAAVLDRWELVGGPSIGVRVMPKTVLSAAWRRQIIKYTAGRQADSRAHLLDLKLEGPLSEKIKGTVSAGAQLRDYDHPVAGLQSKARTLQSTVRLDYAASRLSSFSLGFSRSVNEAVAGGNLYYISTGGDLGARRKLQSLTFGADVGMQVDRYPGASTVGGLTARRRDELYRGGLTLDYAAKQWLSFGLSQQRLQRHSTFTREFNYKANRTALEMRVTF